MTGVTPQAGSGHSPSGLSQSPLSQAEPSVPNAALIDIEALPWRGMDDAPRDGTIIAVRYHEWNVDTNPAKIQFAQWMDVGSGGKFYAPFNTSSEPYAEAWLPLDALNISIEPIGGDQ